MSRIDAIFARLRSEGRTAFMPYITGGLPDWSTFRDLLFAADEAGADMMEIGVPFSDPLADGPVIQLASQKALEAGVTLETLLRALKDLRPHLRAGLALMSYYNPVLQFGVGAFASALEESGIDAVILPDVPFEEREEVDGPLQAHGIALAGMVAPTSPEVRARKILAASRGFAYVVSLTGVTGARQALPTGVEAWLDTLRHTWRPQIDPPLPICLGFGIGTPEQAAQLAPHADGLIVGSALVKRILDAPPSKVVEEVSAFIRTMKKAMAAGN